MNELHWITHATYAADLLIRIGLSMRVIRRRLPVGVALAWLAIILIFPFVGAVFYLVVGEYRLGRGRARRAATYQESLHIRPAEPENSSVTPAVLEPGCAGVARLAESTIGAAILPGNQLELLENADVAFPKLIGDIDRARHTCDLEFYIWEPGGRADEVAAAVTRAAKRGVQCRVLVDAVGSKKFMKSGTVRDLRQSGVRVVAALPAGILRLLLRRPDLRLHRKIAVMDGEVAYTGSLNLADPLLFKREAGVGQWVDALARVRGPVVQALAATFRKDWALETGETLPLVERPALGGPVNPENGMAAVQVLPTGPDARVDAMEQVVLMALYAATREVVLTTPYFVPSESLLTALLSAAGRGVVVTLIVPAKVDSRLVHFASRAFQMDLLAAGVRTALYQGGLLHTKSITVDGQMSLFGSLNLDPRSMRLDFEITLAVYDLGFTTALRRLQQHYLEGSIMLDLASCQVRSSVERFAEDTARLVGPVL